MNSQAWYAASRARRLFSISAYLSLAVILTLVLLVVVAASAPPEAINRLQDSLLVQTAGFLLGLIGTPAAIFLWLGMLWHARVEHKGLTWLLVLILGNWVVAPLYYRVVFRQSFS